MEPIFNLRQSVKVPTRVHPSGKATVVAHEREKDNKFLNYNGWVYSLAFSEGGEAFRVNEEELTEWQK